MHTERPCRWSQGTVRWPNPRTEYEGWKGRAHNVRRSRVVSLVAVGVSPVVEKKTKGLEGQALEEWQHSKGGRIQTQVHRRHKAGQGGQHLPSTPDMGLVHSGVSFSTGTGLSHPPLCQLIRVIKKCSPSAIWWKWMNKLRVLVSWGCHNKAPNTGWLISNRSLFLTVLEAVHSRSRHQHGSMGPLFPVAGCWLLVPHIVEWG